MVLAMSSWSVVLSGIPQIFVLGPLLSLCYNNLPLNVDNQIYLFADNNNFMLKLLILMIIIAFNYRVGQS